MDSNYDKVKKKLSEELEWLKENHPLSLFSHLELNIYNAKHYNDLYQEDHNDHYEEKETDAFLMETIEEQQLQHAIFLIISEQHVLDEVDKMVLTKGNVKEEHLFYFMLYHEYGHLVHLHNSYQKKGLTGYLDEKEEMEEQLERLILLKEKEEIAEEEFHIRYRELWFEQYADNFAYAVYQKRKETFEEN